MRYAVAVLMCILFSGPASAQRIRFSDSANVWQTLVNVEITPPIIVSTRTYAYSGSELINGKKYLNLAGNLIYEDTTAGIVYIRYQNDTSCALDTVDQILYNYNWEVGDTVTYEQCGSPQCISWVTSVTKISIGVDSYKVWGFTGHFASAIFGFGYNVIEGIGCVQEFYYPVCPYNVGLHSCQLICFHSDVPTSALSSPVVSWGLAGNVSFDNATSCHDTFLSVAQTVPLPEYRVYPNPADEMLTITAPDIISTLSVTDPLGRSWYTSDHIGRNSTTIRTDALVPGIYYLIVNGQYATRFLKK
jgi:Secretion system C-terminal sorting domain